MRRILQPLAVGATILGAGLGSFVWLSSMKAAPARENARETRPLVETRPLEQLRSEFDIRLDGTVVPQREIVVAAEIAGEIVQKSPLCQAGKYVTAGTPLLDIDPQKYELEVERLQSLVRQSEVDLQRIEVERKNVDALIDIAQRDLDLKGREFQRVGGLVKRNAAAVGERDTVEATILVAQTTLQRLTNQRDLFPSQQARAEAEVRLKRSELAAAEIDLRKTKITAPISGVIVSAPVECRQFVNLATTLVQIEDTSVVEVSCRMRVDDLYWLWGCSHELAACQRNPDMHDSGQPCYEIPPARATVTFRLGDRQFQWDGRLARYEGTGIDAKTRTVPCRVVVEEPRRADRKNGPPALVRGMFVEVALHVDSNEQLLQIPHDAVRPNGEVFAVADGKLRVYQVDAARVLSDALLVRATSTDLRIGDALVVSPLASGFDGMEVREQNAP
jgi:RND family efflux transporter MFP subunit